MTRTLPLLLQEEARLVALDVAHQRVKASTRSANPDLIVTTEGVLLPRFKGSDGFDCP